MANPNPHQLYNIGQKALITYKNEALAVLDAKHGDWTLPGGRIDQNEDPDRAQEREILEETGITLKDHSFVKRLLGREQWDQY
ncbi:NUDIX domain-containing protein, partial [Candidatus Dojkabacteria bacterium]|nr:NUDIX domain-containing protein [Candidatus Dojkabacteria bacterium]